MRMPATAFSFCLLAGLLRCSASDGGEVKLHLTVPKVVAEQATQSLRGEANVPAPVLILEGVQFPSNQGLTFEVLGEPKRGSAGARQVLAVTGSVAQQPPETPNPTVQKITMPVPLNAKAAAFLAGQSEVTL